jgi:hypothetical protein
VLIAVLIAVVMAMKKKFVKKKFHRHHDRDQDRDHDLAPKKILKKKHKLASAIRISFRWIQSTRRRLRIR